MRTRADVLAYRIHAQELDRPSAPRGLTDAAIFDFGVQDTSRDGASLGAGQPRRAGDQRR
jgi:hypothetical protein